jgi:uncharacterized protein (TIGR03086 family)
MTSFVDLQPTADRVVALLPAIDDDLLDRPTPSADTSVGDLLSHLHGLADAFRAGAEKQPDSGPPPARPPALTPDWRVELPARLTALVQAWRTPAAREGTTSVGGVSMPAAMVAVVALDELLLHGWDLARATGQAYDADPEAVAACHGFVAAMARPEGVPGLFGPPFPVPDDASALDQLLGMSGRNPAWTAPVEEARR